MENIKLKIKLSAYTKGVIPDVTEFIKDVDDNKIYVRTHGEWIDLQDIIESSKNIVVDEGSGLDLIYNEDDNSYNLSVRQKVVKENDLSEELEDDTTYYVIENKKPELYINGGTAYSDENQEYKIKLVGGDSKTNKFDLKILPVDSKGVQYDRTSF